MKRVLTFSFLTALVLCGCQEREPDVVVPESGTFTATIADNFQGGDTKTSLDAEGNVLWKKGDQISVFAGDKINRQYQVSDASEGKTAASLEYVSSGSGSQDGIDNNVAFYPYTSTAFIIGLSNYSIGGITLPATQQYAESSFGNGVFPMVAVTGSTEDRNFKFKNVLGGLKLQLTGTATIALVSITGNKNTDILCGAAEVTVSSSDVPSVDLTDASATTVTLDCGTGVQLNTTTATSFVIALPPQEMELGFTVVVTATDGRQMEISTSKPQTITRSSLLRMPAVVFEGALPIPEAVDLGLSVKWASFNLGASSPEEYGDYYAWGETKPYYSSLDPLAWKTGKGDGYAWASYKWCGGTESSLTKYCNQSSYGSVDDKTVLDPEDDAATVNLGGLWRMPTDAEWAELIQYCTWIWTTQNGVNGYRVTGKKEGYTDNSIFLPTTAGAWWDGISLLTD